MKIKKIRIQNFRAFEDSGDIDFEKFNCIIGKNDSGKSTIFAALEWFFSDKDMGKYDININCIDNVLFDNNELYVEIIFSDIIFDVDKRNKYSFKCDTDFLKQVNIMVRKNYDNHYIISVSNELGNGYIDCNTSYYQLDDMFHKLYDSYRNGDCNITIKNKRQLEKIEFDEMIKNCGLKLPQFKCFSPSHPLKDYLNLLFRVRFYHNDFDKNIIDTKSNITSDINVKMQTKYPNTECYFDTIMSQIDFFPLEDLMLKSNDSSLKNIPLCNRGEGFQWEIKNAVCRLLAESVSSGNDNNYIFAFEEPETHLHPRAQLEMYKTIKELSEKSNCQVFITTHSPYIVKQLAKDNIKPIVVKRDENLKVSKISKLEERVLPYISMNEMNYIAFDEPSIEYHIELFGFMQNKLNIHSVKLLDNWIQTNCSSILTSEDFFDWYDTRSLIKESAKMTLPFCVRNNIDHPLVDDVNDATKHNAYENNKKFNDEILIKRSIEIMRNAIITHQSDFS